MTIKVADYHLVNNNSGGWDKRPGRLEMAMSIKPFSTAEIKAKTIVSHPKIGAHYKRGLVKRLCEFITAYDSLYKYLHTNHGNIPVVCDSPELHNFWHIYLFKGRELIDAVGNTIHICFGLNQKTKGLNKKKFESTKKVVIQAIQKKPELQSLLDILSQYEKLIIEFIELRNEEKSNNNTLNKPPIISENGIPTAGSIINIEKTFVEYFEYSYLNILAFTKSIVKKP